MDWGDTDLDVLAAIPFQRGQPLDLTPLRRERPSVNDVFVVAAKIDHKGGPGLGRCGSSTSPPRAAGTATTNAGTSQSLQLNPLAMPPADRRSPPRRLDGGGAGRGGGGPGVRGSRWRTVPGTPFDPPPTKEAWRASRLDDPAQRADQHRYPGSAQQGPDVQRQQRHTFFGFKPRQGACSPGRSRASRRSVTVPNFGGVPVHREVSYRISVASRDACTATTLKLLDRRAATLQGRRRQEDGVQDRGRPFSYVGKLDGRRARG